MPTLDTLRFEMKVGDKFVLRFHGRERLAVLDKVAKQGVHFRYPETNEEQWFRHRNVRRLYGRGDLRSITLFDSTEPYFGKLQRKLDADFKARPESEQLDAAKALWAIQWLDKRLGPREGITNNVISALHKEAREKFGNANRLSRANLYRLRKDWLQSGGRIEAITPNVQGRGNTTVRYPERVAEIAFATLRQVYCTRDRASLDVTYKEFVVALREENEGRSPEGQLPTPSINYLAARLRDLDPHDVTEAREGEQAARQKHGGFGKGETPTRPLEVVQIDHTPIDLIAIDDELRIPIGRIYLTVAIDVFTKCIVGFHISMEKPSYESVARCLAHAISFKDYVSDDYPGIKKIWPCFGLPHRILVDRGAEFRSFALEMACCALGISIEYTKKKNPHLKAVVERRFRKINKDRFQTVSGTTFSNYMQRNGYQPEKYTVATISVIREAFHILVIEDDLESEHRALLSNSRQKWNKHVEMFPPRMPASQADLDIALGREELKSVHAYGVETRSIRYGVGPIAAIRGHRDYDPKKKYRVKTYSDNLTYIHVLNDAGQWVELRANNEDQIRGLTAAHWRTLRDFCRHELKTSIDKIGIAQAVVRLRELLQGGVRSKVPRTRTEIQRARMKNALDRRDGAPSPGGKKGPASKAPWLSAAASSPDQPAAATRRSANNSESGWSIEYDTAPIRPVQAGLRSKP